MKFGSIITSLIFMIFAVVIFTQSLDLRPGVGGDVGAGFFPRAISVMIMVCGIVIIIQELRKNSGEKLLSKYVAKALLLGIMTVAYVFLMNLVGFIIVTPIYIFLFLFFINQRKWHMMAIYSVVLTASVYTVFRVILNVRLATTFLGI